MSLPIYEPGQAESYVAGKGWNYKRSGDELVLELCPFCAGGPWQFYLNGMNGLWDCKRGACAKKGNFWQLQREMGDLEVRSLTHQRAVLGAATSVDADVKRYPLSTMDAYQANLDADAAAVAYLEGRGITIETARAWCLGLTGEGKRQLIIPMINQQMEITGVRYRTLPPQDKLYLSQKGGGLVLFGEHMLAAHKSDKPKTLYLAEGELDAMTLWQHGYRPVVSTTAGAGTFKAEWYDIVEAFDPETIYITYDSDPAGQKGAEDLKKRFEHRNVINVALPDVKDVNEYFQTHNATDFNELLKETPAEGIEGVTRVSVVADELETHLFLNGNSFDGIPTGYAALDSMMNGGWWRGELITVSGSAGTGKTSFVLQEMNRMAEVLGQPGYFLCLECPEKRMLMKLIEHRERVPQLRQTLADVQKARKTLDALDLYLGYKAGSIEQIADRIYAAVRRLGIQVVAFDNINYFVRSIGQSQDEIAKTTKTLKEVAVAANIIMMGIAQPLKFDTSEREIRQSDLKGSSAIEQDSDTVVLLYRKPKKPEAKRDSFALEIGSHSPVTLVQVTKSRWGTGGRMYLYFDGAYSSYRELKASEMGGADLSHEEAAA